jgi:putative restriction endonuclease
MFTLAVTDLGWHASHLARPPLGVVNFWTPTLWRPKLDPESKLFFMLKAPVRKIGGFGYVAEYREETVESAWTLFGTGNGVPSSDALRTKVDEFAAKRSASPRGPSTPIGCIVLRDAVFFDREQQVAPEELGLSFPKPVVTYKRFDGDLVLPGTAMPTVEGTDFEPLTSSAVERGERTVVVRPEQAAFRRELLNHYGRRCAFLGTRAPETLDAAHIQPYQGPASNHSQNGIPLRKDLHALFDAGLMSVADDYTILVAPSLGHPYDKLHGKRMRLPKDRQHWPSKAALSLHRKTFRGPLG